MWPVDFVVYSCRICCKYKWQTENMKVVLVCSFKLLATKIIANIFAIWVLQKISFIIC